MTGIAGTSDGAGATGAAGTTGAAGDAGTTGATGAAGTAGGGGSGGAGAAAGASGCACALDRGAADRSPGVLSALAGLLVCIRRRSRSRKARGSRTVDVPTTTPH
jgi:hypothetical protein